MKYTKAIIHVLTILSFLFIAQYSNGQADKDITIFHRLLIYNSNDELMVVKIENADFWVTPGMYQNKQQSIRRGLDSIALTYGITIDSLELKGLFVLKRAINSETSTSLRNVYVAKAKEISPKMPEGIGRIEWLSHKQAMEKITFPHITSMIDQIKQFPNKIWSATLLQYREEDIWKSKIIEDFYEL